MRRASFPELLLALAAVAMTAGRSSAQQTFPLVEEGRATPLLVSNADHDRPNYHRSRRDEAFL
jgi:hypothetical protein